MFVQGYLPGRTNIKHYFTSVVTDSPVAMAWLEAPALNSGRPEHQYEKTGQSVGSTGFYRQVFGAGEGIRTLDVNLGKVALYH